MKLPNLPKKVFLMWRSRLSAAAVGAAASASWIQTDDTRCSFVDSLFGAPPKSLASRVLAPGSVAVITGASTGIGRAMARKCASLKMKVVMADVDEAELDEAAREVAALAASPADVSAVATDVSDPDAVERLRALTFAKHSRCNLLMNNAGVGSGGGALAPRAAWEKTLGVNTWGPIHGCQAFVPAMRASGAPGLVVNTGSKQGITAPPGNLAYNVSKAALKTFTEGLEHELRQDDATKAGGGGARTLAAALLVPGWVNTSILLKSKRAEAEATGAAFDADKVFFQEAKPAKGAWMPDQVVDFLLQELEAGRFYVICPDHEVDRSMDNLRMTWAMQDITRDRPPLSRWHPEYKEKFAAFVEASKWG